MKRALSILLVALMLLVALPTVAEEGELQAGLYVSDAGAAVMYLYEEGVGVLNCLMDGRLYCNGVVWTETSLEIEREAIPFATTGDVLSFTYGNTALALRCMGESEDYVLGDQAGSAFAGVYEAEDGRKLTLEADGQGVYADAAGEQPIYWGSFLSYFEEAEGQTVANCYILYGSYLGAMDFVDGQAVLDTETDGKVTFAPAAAPEAPEAPGAVDTAATTLISPAYDLCLTLPGAGWIVEESETGLLASREAGLIQFTFLSLALDQAPNAAMLDAYADHIWTDGLMGAGVAYDAADTVRSDRVVGEAAGRSAATEWTRDDVACVGDSVLWYANGRLYAALSVAPKDNRVEALALLDAALLTLRTAEEAAPANQLPLDKEVFEGIRDLAPVEAAADEVYYGYRMTTDGQTIDLIPFLSAMGMDPKAISLTLRADGTGRLVLMDEEDSAEFTWTEDAFTADGESIPYTRESGHILISMGEESVEFAPEAEMEALLAQTAGPETKGEDVVPTEEALIGNWTFTKARAMGMEIPASMMGTEMALVLNEDGSAILLVDGAPTEMAWTIGEDGQVSLTAAGEEVLALGYDGAVLTLDTGSEAVLMVFEKDA